MIFRISEEKKFNEDKRRDLWNILQFPSNKRSSYCGDNREKLFPLISVSSLPNYEQIHSTGELCFFPDNRYHVLIGLRLKIIYVNYNVVGRNTIAAYVGAGSRFGAVWKTPSPAYHESTPAKQSLVFVSPQFRSRRRPTSVSLTPYSFGVWIRGTLHIV